MMNTKFFATCILGALAMAGGVHAQTAGDAAPVGKQAGTFLVHARLIDVDPQDTSSSTSIKGTVHTDAQLAPEVDVSYFFTSDRKGPSSSDVCGTKDQATVLGA